MVAVLPLHTDDALLSVLPAIAAVTVTVTVLVIVMLQEEVAFVASTLKVVVLVKFPVGRLIVPPVPATTDPTFVLPVLFLSW